MIRFEDAEERHAHLIARCMRARDVAEVRAGWGKAPYQAIRSCLAASYYARVCFYGLEPLAIYGLIPLVLLGDIAQVWVFGTHYIDEHPLAFARASRKGLRELHERAYLLTNVIVQDDPAALRWLKWLGGSCELAEQRRGDRVFRQFFVRNPCLQA